MIFYFSSTGNCRYVAQHIAEALADRAVSMMDCLNRQEYAFPDCEMVGIVTPTYAWGLPDVVERFLQNVRFESRYTFFIATYGTTPGNTLYFAEQFLQRKCDAAFSIRMPDNFTPWFDLSDAAAVNAQNEKATAYLNDVICLIRKRETGNFMKNAAPDFTSIFHGMAYDWLRKTSRFRVEDTCIGCGLCAAQCPSGAIAIQNGKPVWTKPKCTMCLGCLHRCPKFAIQYGNSKAHGQYQHPPVNAPKKKSS